MATRIQKQTAQRMIDKLNKQLDDLFEEQEMSKGGRVGRKCARGCNLRRPKAQFGAALTGGLSQALSTHPTLGVTPGTEGVLSNLISGLTGGIGNLGSNILGTEDISGQGHGQGHYKSRIGRFLGSPLAGKIGKGLGEIGYMGAAYAPAMYNLIQGLRPADQLSYADYRNPEYNRAVSLMAGRRYDPREELAAAEEADAVYRQALRNIGAQSAGTLANRLAGASTRRLRNRASALSRAQRENLGLRGEEAKFRAGLGAEDVGTRFAIEDINARTRAARRRYMSEAMSNLSNIAQTNRLTNRLMRNQRLRDERLYELAKSMASPYAFDEDYRLRFEVD